MPAELPKTCADYITKDLGRDLSEVVAHRRFRSECETYMVVLMCADGEHWTVGFTGQYDVVRSLGDWEEACEGNGATRLTGWDCQWDSEPWPHSPGRFKTARYEHLFGDE